MRIFMISPVRNISEAFLARVGAAVAGLEQQHSVYWPMRDTYQDQPEVDIVRANFAAIGGCDEVYICWDGESEGCLFDLGMAFALGKPIRPVVGCVPRMTRGKSFANLIHALGEE